MSPAISLRTLYIILEVSSEPSHISCTFFEAVEGFPSLSSSVVYFLLCLAWRSPLLYFSILRNLSWLSLSLGTVWYTLSPSTLSPPASKVHLAECGSQQISLSHRLSRLRDLAIALCPHFHISVGGLSRREGRTSQTVYELDFSFTPPLPQLCSITYPWPSILLSPSCPEKTVGTPQRAV